MKKIIYFLLLLTLAACQEGKKTNSNQPNKVTKTAKPQQNSVVGTNEHLPATVEQIKMAYAKTIKKMKSKALDSLVLRYNCQNERSGTITYFTENGKLLMISHRYAEHDHYEARDNYFVKNNQLYFVYSHELYWSFVSSKATEVATRDDVTEKRTYLIGKKPVLCLEKKYSFLSYNASTFNPDVVPNKTVTCKAVTPMLQTFTNLKAFKNLARRDCFGK